MWAPDLLFEVQSENPALSRVRAGLFIHEGFQAMKYTGSYELCCTGSHCLTVFSAYNELKLCVCLDFASIIMLVFLEDDSGLSLFLEHAGLDVTVLDIDSDGLSGLDDREPASALVLGKAVSH